jgi:DNA ligase-1
MVSSRALRAFAVAASGLPDWLFVESYGAVGDLAETIALLLPPPARVGSVGLAQWMNQRLLALREQSPEAAVLALHEFAQELDTGERFVLIKLIGGGFRVGVSRALVTRALAEFARLDPKVIAQRLIGYTDAAAQPTAATFAALCAPEHEGDAPAGSPYPFFLAHPFDAALSTLGARDDWLVEWKYDGLRAQLVRRAGQTWLWSRGEELITERFPEIAAAALSLPDGTVLDGEVLVWDEDAPDPAPFARLQTRIGRKTVSAKFLLAHPARFLAFDLLEDEGVDLRALPQAVRRERLERRLGGARERITPTPLLRLPDWPALAELRESSRARGVEGLMLKQREARYGVGRTKDVGLWWKWKIDPMRVDAVLVYAQRGHGRRASLYTDYTFAVWDRAPRDAAEAQLTVDAIAAGVAPELQAQRGLPRLVPFTKAYSGLSDAEIRRVDAVIRRTTREKFGPVRSVVPSLVVEIGFEGIQASKRHSSGIAVRFPRIVRLRDDKLPYQADTLQTLQELLGEGD